MSYTSRAFDKPNADGFPPDPVVSSTFVSAGPAGIKATEQALQCDAFGEGVCCQDEGHDGGCDPEPAEQAPDPVDTIVQRAVVRCADMDGVSVDTCGVDRLDRYRDYVTATLAELPMDVLGQLSPQTEATEPARTEPVMEVSGWCERCGCDVSGENHYHCAKCGQRTSMMGHRDGCPPVPAPATPTVPRVWRKGDPMPEDVWKVRDVHGDVWTRNVIDEWTTPETKSCGWPYMAKKWAPLTEVIVDGTQ